MPALFGAYINNSWKAHCSDDKIKSIVMPAKKKPAVSIQRRKAVTSDFDNNQKLDDEELQQEKQTLMNKFLHEIYKELLNKKISRTKFASLLDISPSYLSQIFYGKKQLTFEILVKCQQVLKIKFYVIAMPEG